MERLHDLYGGLWVLKGAGTLVGPNPIYVNPFADSILATAGSGDVLAGVIGGLLSQNLRHLRKREFIYILKRLSYSKQKGEQPLLRRIYWMQ